MQFALVEQGDASFPRDGFAMPVVQICTAVFVDGKRLILSAVFITLLNQLSDVDIFPDNTLVIQSISPFFKIEIN